MRVFQLLDEIKRRPGIYLDGEKSLRRLRSFIVGYDGGLGACGVQLEDAQAMSGFDKWVAHRLGFGGSTSGWCNMILSKTESDEKAYERFFELLQEYREDLTVHQAEQPSDVVGKPLPGIRRGLSIVHMTLLFDPDDPQLRAKLNALAPTPGYCVLVDIVGSTAMKDAPFLEWTPKIHNAFANTMAFLDPRIRPLKSIGDELMFYITCEQMRQLGEVPLHLYSGLFSVAGERDPLFTDVKIAIAYCENAYPLSFLRGVDDVYGKDIDLTARLLSKAQPREIVMNEPFARMVKADFDTAGNQDQFPEVGRIKGPFPEDLKGFATPVPVFKAAAR